MTDPMETNDGLAECVVYYGVLLSAFHSVRSEQTWTRFTLFFISTDGLEYAEPRACSHRRECICAVQCET